MRKVESWEVYVHQKTYYIYNINKTFINIEWTITTQLISYSINQLHLWPIKLDKLYIADYEFKH